MVKQLQPHIVEVTRKDSDVAAMVLFRHYLQRWPGVVVCVLSLRIPAIKAGGVYERAMGCMVFALPPRETHKRYGGHTWELARLWVSDEMPRNTESWFISQATRHIRKTRPDVACIVSYADPSVGHTGTIYRAANFIADGRTDQERKTPRFDYQVAGKRYSRRAHVPAGAVIERVPRVSKFRFVFYLQGHEARRSAA